MNQQIDGTHFLCHPLFQYHHTRCPSVGAAAPCTIVSGDLRAPYPHCCPRVECPSQENEIESNEDDQVMMASYDVTLGNENLQQEVK